MNLSSDVQHQQPLKKSVLAVLVVRAELGLPSSFDGRPESTQHAASETAILGQIFNRCQCSLEHHRGFFDETQSNEVHGVFFLHHHLPG